jgi:predicted GIY-YIG superfamily endonuclease
MWHLYILESEKDGIHYIGISEDVNHRLKEHNSGKNHFTKGHRPWRILYTEEFSTASEARQREKYFKTGAGRRYIKENIMAVPGSPPDRLNEEANLDYE